MKAFPKLSLLLALAGTNDVLMILGITFFVILAIALIVMLIRKQNVVVLLPFFILPIVMIAFPSITHFKGGGFEFDTHTLQEQTKIVANNPHDELAKQKLGVSLQQAEKAVTTNNSTADAAESIAAAHLALGQPAKAQPWVSAALKKDPSSARAKLLQQQARVIRPATEVQKNVNS